MKGLNARHLHTLLRCLPVHSPPCSSSLTAINNTLKVLTPQHHHCLPGFSNARNFYTKIPQNHDKAYVPRRTVMYVPGHDPSKLMKIPNLGVDCAVMECEDGVALNMKAEARKNIKQALSELSSHSFRHTTDLALRVNSVSSQLMEDDLEAIIGDGLGQPLGTEALPATILLPKVDCLEDLIIFTDRLQSVKLGRDYQPRLITYVESAEGLINMKDVLHKATQYSKDGAYHIDGVVFGSDDFCADIGAERTLNAMELLYARQKIVMMAKAYRLQAIDMVYINIKDLEGLRQSSEEGARKGYTGKQVIHPGQVEVVQAAFTPDPQRVTWAQELIQAFEEHQASGKGAMTFRGQMIDMPLLRQAQNVMQIVKNVKHKE